VGHFRQIIRPEDVPKSKICSKLYCFRRVRMKQTCHMAYLRCYMSFVRLCCVHGSEPLNRPEHFGRPKLTKRYCFSPGRSELFQSRTVRIVSVQDGHNCSSPVQSRTVGIISVQDGHICFSPGRSQLFQSSPVQDRQNCFSPGR